MTDYENQPTVVPLPGAVGFVLAAMRSIKEVDDATTVMRSLLNDSLLCRAREWRALRPRATGRSGKRTEWADVFDMMSGWWPVWNTPVDAPAGMPPDGTFAAKHNATRACRSSRWTVRVDMGGVNDVLKMLSARSYRYFPKNALPTHEVVGRYSASTKLRLPAAAAMMLLVASKDESFGPILGNMASAGRPTAPRSAPLASATYHDFTAPRPVPTTSVSAGGVAASPTPPSSSAALSSSLPPVVVQPRGPSDALDLAGPVATFPDELFDNMDALLEKERAGEGAHNRSVRLAMRRASGRPPLSRSNSQVPDPVDGPQAASVAAAGRGTGKRKPAKPRKSPSPPPKRRAVASTRGGRGGGAPFALGRLDSASAVDVSLVGSCGASVDAPVEDNEGLCSVLSTVVGHDGVPQPTVAEGGRATDSLDHEGMDASIIGHGIIGGGTGGEGGSPSANAAGSTVPSVDSVGPVVGREDTVGDERQTEK